MLRALMILLPLALTIYAFIDCLNTPEDEVKHLPKVVWVIIILLFWVVGPVVWLFSGKKRQATARGGRGGGWVAPDDNPEFLKSLGGDERSGSSGDRGRGDESMFKDWEDDLRRREDEPKHRDEGGEKGEDTDQGKEG
ncbi:PLD nuclease N-terminal domain-containing protein [Streptomyces sp. NRRL F-5727]|uniref:PLD nuclease N-terminal domain-containing protein n=1 Tax=Streptomyces sp. NRRL F-5727 TaxID=1463871 RepID=UPI0004C7C69E|nr:PLD nuclease N-terminal domain-containing protein [Streptomyces sp. NRRL F-5727]